jgi:hypothetical protein
MYKYNFNNINETGVVKLHESALKLKEDLTKAIAEGGGSAGHH